MIAAVKAVIQTGLELIFPRLCISCHTLLVAEEPAICVGCLSSTACLPYLQYPTDNPLYYKFAGRFSLIGAVAAYEYRVNGQVQQWIHALKYGHTPQAGTQIGRWFAHKIMNLNPNWIKQFQALIPIPLHPNRQFIRGYNQVEIVTQAMAPVLRIPVRKRILVRSRNTYKQAQLTAAQRYTNVKDAFSIVEDPPENVLLVDDVITTGATIASAAQTLLAQPSCKNVGIMAIATPV
jgi:ComF family protein